MGLSALWVSVSHLYDEGAGEDVRTTVLSHIANRSENWLNYFGQQYKICTKMFIAVIFIVAILGCVPQSSYIEILTPSTLECDYLEKRLLKK